MTDLSKMTDQDLVAKAQSYKTECPSRGVYVGELYQRYIPLINKHAGILFRHAPKDRTYYEDFVQDAYFAVDKAVNLVKWEKVKPGWKFSRVLWSQLQKLRATYTKRFTEQGREVSTMLAMYPIEASGDDFTPDLPDPINAYKHLHVDINYYRPYTEQLSDEQERFLGSLTEEERRILRYRQQGYTLAGAARMMGSSYSRVQRTVVECKARAAKIFDVAYS